MLSQFEEQITPKLKWQKIDDIPDFPLSNFDDVKQKMKTKEFSVGIDFTTANNLAQYLYGQGHKYFFLLLASTPIIVAIGALFLSFVHSNFWLLFGIVLGFAGWFLSNPYNPSKKNFWKPIVGTIFLVFLYGLWQEQQTITYLSAFFVFPFFINTYVYSMNQRKLELVALESEKVFIYLYQNEKLGLRHNENDETYWYFGSKNEQ